MITFRNGNTIMSEKVGKLKTASLNAIEEN
jgi:hypothetical protein